MIGLVMSAIVVLAPMAVGAGIGYLVAGGGGAFFGAFFALFLAGLAFFHLGFEGYLEGY